MKYFSPDTRRKLSEAMKERWARHRAEEAERLAALQATADAEARKKREEERDAKLPSITELYAAAAAIKDSDTVREAVLHGIETRHIIAALAAYNGAGTSTQKRIRDALRHIVLDAIGYQDVTDKVK